MNFFSILDWDSQFFGYNVARMAAHVTLHNYPEALTELHDHNIRLVYWAAEPQHTDLQNIIVHLGGQLVDKKTTFVKTVQTPTEPRATISVTLYNQTVMTPELGKLAIQAGLFSRFQIDPQIGYDKFVELYQLWMKKSIRRELAEDVLVARDETQGHRPVIGVVTVGQKNGIGDIGLVAVDEAYRGQGVASALMQAVDRWFYDHHYRMSQVVTQGDNTAACRLYTKAGYTIGQVEWLYHYWIDGTL